MSFSEQRARMVERQLRRRGISDERVLRAMEEVPREIFVPAEHRRRAYADGALPIGFGQTISQPWIVAAICQALRLEGDEKILEVGAGSGYSTAVLSRLVDRVFAIERIPELAAAARRALEDVDAGNVEVIVADGSVGLSGEAPFDGIAVHATAPAPPASLLEQLDEAGRLVIPIATDRADMLIAYARTAEPLDLQAGKGLEQTVIGPCRFVPLIGDEGFPD